MPRPSSSLAELRSLVAAWNPHPVQKAGVVPTGVAAIDEEIGGGLPGSQLTEMVAGPASGGQLVLAEILATTRTQRQRVALIDTVDTFAPEAILSDHLRHLVWARCHDLPEAFSVADILVRDGNYTAVVFDLRDVPVVSLNRFPKTHWHRLHRVAERQPAAVLVLSRFGLVPAVQYRIELSPVLTLAGKSQPRPEILAALRVALVRGTQGAERTG